MFQWSYVYFTTIYCQIIFSADGNKNDIIYNQSGVNRRVFSGYVSFPEVEKNTLFYMKAFLLTLTVDIPCKEEIHSLIKIFCFDNFILNQSLAYFKQKEQLLIR